MSLALPLNAATAAITLEPLLPMLSFSFAGACSALLPLVFRSVVLLRSDSTAMLFRRSPQSSDFRPAMFDLSPLTRRPIALAMSAVKNALCGLPALASVGLSCGCWKFRCFDGEYISGVYFTISFFSSLVDLWLSLVLGLESLCVAVVANCAHIGAFIGCPLDDDGGVVFSLSLGTFICERSLLERFILENMLDRFAEDLDFCGEIASSSFVGFFGDDRRSLLVFEEVMFRALLFEGEDGGDCTFDPRSPNGLLFVTA